MTGKFFIVFQKTKLNSLKFYLFASSLFISSPSFADSATTVSSNDTYTISGGYVANIINNGTVNVTSTGRLTGATTNNNIFNNTGSINTLSNYGHYTTTNGNANDTTNAAAGLITGTSGNFGNTINSGTINVTSTSFSSVTNEQNATFTSQSGYIWTGFDNSGTASLTSSSITGDVTNRTSGTLTTTGAVNGSIQNYGTLNLNSGAMVAGNVVNTSGTLNISGITTMILGNLDAEGGTFNVNNGAVNSLSGSANGTVQGILAISRGSNTVYSGILSGSGGISISSGTQGLSGQNTYTGSTSVSAGASLQLSGSIAGSLTNNSMANAPTVIASGAEVHGNVLNFGSLSVNGTVGGVVINLKGATIQATNNATFNQSITNSGTVNLNNSSTIKGGVTNTSGSTFTLAGASSIAGTVNNAGTFNITTNALVGGAFTNSTTLNMDAGTIQGALSNTGVATVQNGSIVDSVENKSGTSTFSDSTISNAAVNDAGGTLSISGGTVGSAVNAGSMTLANSNTVSGTVTNTSGSLTLDGNTITGALLANGGSFTVTSNGSTLGSLSGSANGSLNGLLSLATASNTYSGILSGTGGIKIAASGTEIFNGDNTYTGSTEVDSGTLAINGNQSSAAGTTLINTSATLSGTGTLGGDTTIKQGGTLTPGDITTRVGTLSIAKDLTLESGSTQSFYLGQTNVSGGAYNSLVAVGGNLTLGGTLNITPNPAGPSVNNGKLDAGLYRLYTYGGTLSGASSQSMAATSVATAGNVSLQTSIAHQVNIVVSYGNLAFWDGGNTANHGNATVDGGSGIWAAQSTGDNSNWTDQTGASNGAWVNDQFVVYAGNAGTVSVQDTKSGQSANVIINGMQFANNDGKSYLITGDDVYAATNSTTIRVGDGTTAGASISAIFDTVLNDQLVSGGTSLVKTDLGTLILSKDQTYQGSTTIADGVLQLGNGGTTGALAAGTAIHNNGILAINHSNTFTLAQTIDGTGGLTQNGIGTTVLSANNTYTGDTTVTAGTLEVDGSIADSTVTASTSGTVSGTGILGNTVIAQGGTLAPSGVQGNLTVQGTLQTDQNATLALQGSNQLSGTTMVLQGKDYQQLQSGLVTVTGSSALAGNVVLTVTPSTSLAMNQYYTILTSANGFSQKSYSLQSNLISPYTFISPSLYYSGNDLDVLMARNSLSFASVTDSRNERETAQMLDRLPQGNPMVQAMEYLNPADARRGMNALSGEIHASARTALIQDSLFVRQAAMDRLDTAECGSAHVDDTLHTASLKTGRKDEGCLAEQPVLWGQAYGSLGHNGGDGNAAALHHTSTGFVMGLDAPIRDNTWRIGGLLSYGRSMFDVGSGRSSSGHGNTVSLGGYAGTHWGALNLKLGVGYTWTMLSLQRNVAFPGYSDRLSSNYMAGTAQGFAKMGYRFHTPYGVAEPFANLAYVNLHTNGYHEHGGAAALRGYGTDAGVGFSTLGVKASSTLHVGKLLLIPHGSLAYRRAFGLTTPTAHATFIAGGSGSMDIAGVPLSVNAAVIEAGLSARLSDRIKIGLSYIGQYGNQSVDSGIKGSVVWQF